MFKSLTNFVQSEKAKWIFVAVVVCIMVYSIMSYSNGKDMVLDNYTGMSSQQTAAASNEQLQPANYGDAKASVDQSMDVSNYQMADTANPDQLLPKDENSKWGDMNPVSTSADGQAMPDLLNAVSRVGIDTIGQTMRNANLQLRSDPTIQKQNVGPWSNSTMEPDLARIPLELGCGAP
jgi:hypothetical protein